MTYVPEEERVSEENAICDKLDPCIIKSDFQIAPIEQLETFS